MPSNNEEVCGRRDADLVEILQQIPALPSHNPLFGFCVTQVPPLEEDFNDIKLPINDKKKKDFCFSSTQARNNLASFSSLFFWTLDLGRFQLLHDS